MNRREFLRTTGTVSLSFPFLMKLNAERRDKSIKPIEGSWFEFQHHNSAEGKYWNPSLEQFSENQWKTKIKEIANTGIRYLVLLDVAIHGKSFYPSSLLPQHNMGCEDPLEAILSAADEYDINFFISNGFFGNWRDPVFLMKDPEINKLRLTAMNELAEIYGYHKSFYGWYYPNETGINGYYDEFFIKYVNTSSSEAAKLLPNSKTLIAPYGTRNVKVDDKYVSQLEKLDVDFIAYQDEVGVEKTQVDESASYFRNLYTLHQKAAKSRIWADVEIFCFEDEVYRSALLPASTERVIAQLEAVSPYVERILIYQYIGMLNAPSSKAFAGHPDSIQLYQDLKRHQYLK